MPVPRRSGESAPPRLEEPDQHIQQDRQQQRDREGDQKAARRTAVDPYATVRGLRCKWTSCRHCVNLAIGLDLQTATRETKAVVHAERPLEERPPRRVASLPSIPTDFVSDRAGRHALRTETPLLYRGLPLREVVYLSAPAERGSHRRR
jgi:hypothetical protein